MMDVSGINANQLQIDRSSAQLSRANTQKSSSSEPVVDVAREMTEMLSGQRGMEANTVNIRTEDETIGTLLDMKA